MPVHMDPTQIGDMQALFRQHMEALELALNVGKQYEQTLASLTMQQPLQTTGAPAKQASRSQPIQQQIDASRRSEAEFNMRDDEGRHKQHDYVLGDNALNQPLLEHASRSSNLGQSRSFRASEFELSNSRDEALLESQVQNRSATKPIAMKEAMFRDNAFKKTGCAQRLHKSIIFNSICFAVVLVNAIWVCVDFERFENYPTKISRIIEYSICGWYFSEILVWFFAFQHKNKVLHDRAFLIDAVIVVSMVWGVAAGPLLEEHLNAASPWLKAWLKTSCRVKYLSFLSVFRLSSLGRFVGLFHPHTRGMSFHATIVFKGLKQTIGLVFWFGLCSLGFAFAFRLLVDKKKVPEFASLLKAFDYLFWSAFASVDKNFISRLLDQGWLPWALIVVFTLIGNLTVAKMMTGVLLQVVMKLVQQDKEKNKTADLERTVRQMSERLDSTGSGCVSKEEFENLMSNADLISSLNSGGVDVAGFIQFTRGYFPKESELTVEDLVRWAKQFCGFKPASVKDMMNLRKLIYLEIDVLRSGQLSQDQIFGEMQAVQDKILEEMQALNRIVEEMQALNQDQGSGYARRSVAAI